MDSFYNTIIEGELSAHLPEILTQCCFLSPPLNFLVAKYLKLKTKCLGLTNWVREPYCKPRTDFFPYRFMAQARSVRAINRREKTRISNLQYGSRRRGSAVCLMSSGTVSIHAGRLEISDALKSKTSQFEIVVKWLLSRNKVLIHNLIGSKKQVLNFYLL